MDEPQYSEVVDDEGHKTGQILDRKTVHEQELWHEIVNVWVMNSKDQVLLQHRAPNVELNPDLWDVAVGTHVKPNEDPTNAAVRCVEKKLGMPLQQDDLRHLFNIQIANPLPKGRVHKVLGHVFLLKRDVALEELVFPPMEVTELAWKPLADVVGEIGGTETASNYYPRLGNYYPQLFEALMQAQEGSL